MTVSEKPLVVLAAGGTGGHVYPAEALAGEMLKRGYRLALITDRRGDAYGGVLGDLETFRVRAGGIAGRGIVSKIRSVFEILLGIIQARSIMKRIKPKAVVGFGGYASVPTMVAACIGNYKTAIHEQNAVLGRANRALARRVDRVVSCFAEIENVPDGVDKKIVQGGMPVRRAVLDEQNVAYPELADTSPINILVLGGSQGARVLSDVIPAAIVALSEPLRVRIQITQQCRPEDIDRVKKCYADADINADLSVFFDDVPIRMARCHLVIARSGASTVAEALTIGRPSIMVPYPFAVDDHQTKNAHAVDDAGAGWLIPEPAFTSEGLTQRIEQLFSVPSTLQKAAECARSASQPDAVKHLAQIIENLIRPDGSNDNGDSKRRDAA